MAISSKTIIPGASASDINNAGQIIGDYFDPATNAYYGYIYKDGNVTPISTTDDQGFYPRQINSSGVVIGSYQTTSSSFTSSYGFLYDHGAVTVIQPPGAFGSALAALNDAGQAVGAYYDAAGEHAFLLANKSMIPLDVPSQVLGFQIKGIDNGGDVIGTYTDPNNFTGHSFEIVNGNRIELSVPGALSTSVEAISKSGKIVGEYYDGSQSHAFEYAGGTCVRVDPAGAVSSSAHLINDSGMVAGTWSDGTKFHAFLYDHGIVTSFDGPSTAPTGVAEVTPNIPPPKQTVTSPMALNDAGQVAGYSFGPGTFNTMSFIYDHGTITPISPAGVTSAGAVAMNAAGDVVGGSSAGVFVASHRNFPSVDISNSLTSGLTAAGVSDLLPSSALTATDLIAPLADASPGFGGAPGFAWNADTTGVMLPGAERFAATSTVF